MILEILNRINEINDNIFSGFDELIENTGMADWLADAIIDSVHVLPLLFIVFLFIELIEYFYAEKINSFMQKSEKTAPLIGGLAAIIPQCGFSIIASTLYLRKFITKGTLIAIYLATSDEAIPILLAEPDKIYYVIPIITVKIIIAIIAGYLIDFLLKDKKYIAVADNEDCHLHHEDDGCCRHSVSKRRKRDLIYHPLKHTFNIFIFILAITIVLNYMIELYGRFDILPAIFSKVRFLEPVLTSILGLIPNCAVSIALTMMLIKGSISFGAAISGLLTNAGLGILVLLRHKDNYKDTINIIGILLIISIISGYLLQIFVNI
ncbi:arsenic efflux protein [bacterium]|nr:arsenic efflux protein [bacterium]